MNTQSKANKVIKNIKKQANTAVAVKKSSVISVYAIVCFLFAFALYSNTLKHAYVLDDNDNFTKNTVITKGVQAIPTILKTTYRYGTNNLSDNIYRPLSQIMFAIEWQISPNDPSLSHLINVFFYALSCLLLFIVLGKYMRKVHVIIPLAITLLYAAHPIHTEVIANIKSRDEIMSFFFLMLSLRALYTWFTKAKWWSLLVSMLLLFLALMSKEGVITMLVLFPIMGFYFTDAKTKTILTGSFILLIPAIIYFIIRQTIITKYSVSSTFLIVDNMLVGAHSPATHFATAIMLLGKYLLLSIIPYQLISDYSFNQIPIVDLANPMFIISLLIYIFILIYVIKNSIKKNMIVFGLLFFLITISLYSNIAIQIGTSFAERLMFLPSLGLCIAFVFFISHLIKAVTDNKDNEFINVLRLKPLFSIIILLILMTFIVKTLVRASEWRNETTLFSNDVERSPNSAHMRLYWGLTLVDNALKEDETAKTITMQKAIEQFQKGLTIYPKYADCYEQLGLAYYRLKDPAKAMTFYNEALKINPKKAVTWNNVGVIYVEQGNYLKAQEAYTKAIAINPRYTQAYLSLGSALGATAKYEEAIVEFKKCLQLDPSNVSACKKLALCFQGLNNKTEAERWLAKTKLLEQSKK